MPGPTSALKNLMLENAGDEIMLYIGAVDTNGDELSGGDPAYTRVPIAWEYPNESNEMYPTESPVINIPGSTQVGGWRCYTALTGGSDLGGKDFASPLSYEGQGTMLIDKNEMGWRFV